MGHPFDIQTIFKIFWKKLEYIFVTILELAESFKTMNRPNAARPDPIRSLTAYFSESMQDKDMKLLHNLHSSLQFMVFKLGIDIFDSFEIVCFSAT